MHIFVHTKHKEENTKILETGQRKTCENFKIRGKKWAVF